MSRRNKGADFVFQPFSRKQKKVLTWWKPQSPYRDYETIICDGAIRSGKTISMITSFILWSLETFEGESFILSGKSMGALKRNVLNPMFRILNTMGIPYRYIRSTEDPRVEIGSNVYYLFGANNESSQDVLQGLTAAGAYADEAALFPRSFVEQMIGRCSIDGAKVWMNCNPQGPFHYIKEEMIDKAEEKKILRLHFTMDDNLTLSEKRKEFYRRMYSGVFYQRNILGLWVMAEGVIYNVFDPKTMVVDILPEMRRYWVGVDYGTSNATTFILCGLGMDDRLYVIDEYYHSGSQSGLQKSPAQYSREFRHWLAKQVDRHGNPIRPEWIFVDPSAEGFIVQLWADGVKRIAKADNAVKSGIELVSSIIDNDLFRVHSRCRNVLKEIASYVWDPKAQQKGEDKPLKQNDHTMDPIRYIANGTINIWIGKGVARNAVA